MCKFTSEKWKMISYSRWKIASFTKWLIFLLVRPQEGDRERGAQDQDDNEE